MVRLVVNISVDSDNWLRSKAKRKGDLSKLVELAIQELRTYDFKDEKVRDYIKEYLEEVKT